MTSDEWIPLLVQGPEDGPLGPDAIAMLRLEAELTAQGIEVGFDPHRPGEYFPTRGWIAPTKLMVPAPLLARAQEIARDVLSAEQETSPAEGPDGEALDAEEPDAEEPRADDDFPDENDSFEAYMRTLEAPPDALRPPRPSSDAQGPPPAIHPGCLTVALSLIAAATLLTALH